VTDTYLNLVNTGFTKKIAKQLGLPRPVPLRRYRTGRPLVDGPVLVLGSGPDADTVAHVLAGTRPVGDDRASSAPSAPSAAPGVDDSPGLVAPGWDLDVRRHANPGDRYAAVVLVLTGLTHPDDLAEPVLTLGSVLKSLAPHARVVTVSRPATPDDGPAVAAARQGVDGILRSVAKELRGGATGNGVVVAESVPVTAASVLGALRFFLSTRSAFVDGQLLAVDTDGGALPLDWERPLEGRVAVVTGAARGIGAAIAETLARDGATVVAVDVPAAGEQLAAVANRVRGTALQLDVTAPDAGTHILEHATARHGRLDIVVHNAGITRDKLLVNMSPEKWHAIIAVNIAAQLRINEQLLTSGDFTTEPRIVALASTSGIAGNRGQSNYAASKGGVIGMVRATAPLLTAFGGTANAVAPGFIETEMTARIPALTRQVARRLNSLQQGGQPVDVAEAVAFLASPQAGGVVGRTLRVCGQNLVGQ
jgi:3-oxoacyl-[acyl-carrier protein] reductase